MPSGRLPQSPHPVSRLVIPSPIGDLALESADGATLSAIRFDGARLTPTLDPPEILALAHRQLGEYFAGDRTVFELPLGARGTPFQHRVWDLVATIPYGRTVTYGSLAARLGLTPGAARAVGGANGSNPLPIVVPCHRVIGSDGTLTGYAGGLARKHLLLQLEGVPSRDDQVPLFDLDALG
ncbi:MAG: methylated-DNA--[protein]-cysteine S-methyltransferase [Actinomycetales bacterium]|nr:methylated-DNA--[protein]-cysteine S-methyltransferase [Actinomycetales bacterium]